MIGGFMIMAQLMQMIQLMQLMGAFANQGQHGGCGCGHNMGNLFGPHGSAVPWGNSGVATPLTGVTHSGPVAPGAEGMLARARSMVGQHERTSGAVAAVCSRTGINPATTPWCASFAMTLMKEHGLVDTSDLSNPNYCPTIKNWASNKGIYGHNGQYSPKPGDAVTFDWDKDGTVDHIGLVERVENGRVYTIEGNSSNRVSQKSYALGSGVIDGYVVSGRR